MLSFFCFWFCTLYWAIWLFFLFYKSNFDLLNILEVKILEPLHIFINNNRINYTYLNYRNNLINRKINFAFNSLSINSRRSRSSCRTSHNFWTFHILYCSKIRKQIISTRSWQILILFLVLIKYSTSICSRKHPISSWRIPRLSIKRRTLIISSILPRSRNLIS